MEGLFLMSTKELQRVAVLGRVTRDKMTIMTAAELMSISYRQCQRLVHRYRMLGACSLAHQLRGRPSNRKGNPQIRTAAVEAYKRSYPDFGPTLASEQMAVREGLVVHPETLRLWLIEEGIWHAREQRRRHRKQRTRKDRFGELIQFDGSHHAWFEQRGPKCCVMTMVDDATGRFHLLFTQDEGTLAAMRMLEAWIAQYGVPKAIYADRLKTYITDREPTIDEQLAGQQPLTQFGRACQKLGIRIIAAHSAQAKGRVENKHGLTQDRLVKQMRLEGISTIEAANKYLQTWLPDANQRFCVPARHPDDMHQPVPKGLDLRGVFCHEETRVVNNDWTVQFNNRWLQILKQPGLPAARSKVIVQEWQDGTLHVLHKTRHLKLNQLDARPIKPAPPVAAKPKADYRPAADHPWRDLTPAAYDLRHINEQLAELADTHLGPVRIPGGSRP
jgi:transposase